MFDSVSPKKNFPDMESKVLQMWKENKIFEKSVNKNPKEDSFVFYDGPPFITGTPHYGTLLSRIAKDVVPRYWTMNGKRVERKWGWDAHGLPIENKVEDKLKLKNRRDIEKVGVDKFVESAYEYTRNTSADWEWYKDKIGQWVDFENAYRTMDQDYMESVIWVFKTLYDKGLIYEGNRVSLFCTRCGTPVSNFEIAMDDSYEVMNDPAVTIKFQLEGEEDTFVLAWTTTPWTLPSNRALVVDEKSDYIKVRRIVNVSDEKSVKAIMTYKDKVGLLYSEKYKLYYLPGGKIQPNEDGQETLVREILEETGYKEPVIKELVAKQKYQAWKDLNTIRNRDTQVYHVDIEDNKSRVSPVMTDEEKEMQFKFVWVDKGRLGDLDYAEESTKEVMEVFLLNKTVGDVVVSENIVDSSERSEYLILAKERLEEVFKHKDFEGEYEIVEEFKGSKLVGKRYEPLFDYFPPNENDFKIYSYNDMVTMNDGTGVVHSAPGFGDIDTEMGEYFGLTTMFSVDEEGKFVDEVTDWAGIYIKNADLPIIKNLRNRNLLFKYERIDHRYPYCYRCHTPLIHKAQSSWYIKVSSVKDKMMETNENINWVPSHIKHGRFGKGIEAAPDWGISRSRYWATPMPVWRDEEGSETVVLGSRDEIRENVQQPITKLILVNSSDTDDFGLAGDLTPEGWEKARVLEKKFEHSVDKIYSGDLKECKETIEPMSLGEHEIPVEINEVFGNPEWKKRYKSVQEKLFSKYNVDSFADIPEEVLEEEFADEVIYLRGEIENIIKENEGKSVVISAIDTIIPLIRSIFQEITLRVAFRTNPRPGEWKSIFFDGIEELNLHKPYIDKFTIKSEKSGKELKRIFDVCDVWLDSASMPYAMWHYPFENKDKLENNFPADFVVEYVAQTRAWFYVMHVISNALFETNPFKNVVTTGVMAGTDGRKMSKSYGNYPDPKETIMKYGADPIRLYFMGSKVMVAEDISFSEDQIKEQVKTIILPLWNSLSFFTTYANLNNYEPSPALLQVRTDKDGWAKVPFDPKDKLNIWIISKLQMAIQNVRASFEDYDLPKATKEFPNFVLDLSRWYIRRSRDKFSEGDREFYDTLYYVLMEISKLIAPLAPFISEEIYQVLSKPLNGAPESIHLTDYPDDDSKFVQDNMKVLTQMEIVREIVNLGQSLRVENGLKVRQPLAEIEIKFNSDPSRYNELEGWMKELISDELNIKIVQEDRNMNDYEGWVQAEGDQYGLVVSIDTNLTPELKREGILRELQRGIQSQRKKSGLNVDDMARVELITNSKSAIEVINMMMDELKTSVNASEINLINQEVETKKVKLEDGVVEIKVKSA